MYAKQSKSTGSCTMQEYLPCQDIWAEFMHLTHERLFLMHDRSLSLFLALRLGESGISVD